MKLLVINPGSTSTKISMYEDEKSLFQESVFHDAPVLLQYPTVNDQMPFRTKVVEEILARHGFVPEDADVLVGRGGGAYSQPSGVTRIDRRLYEDTRDEVGGSEHAAKLGVMLAWEIGSKLGKEMYTLDPTNVDELCDQARLTGIRGVYRNAQSHTLNQRATARYHAEQMGKRYEDCNFVVAHIDGGVTVGAHCHGRMIDGNVGSGGDGAFAPTRIGSVPVMPLLDYIDAHSTDDVRLMCHRAGGLVSLFGTSDAAKVHTMVENGDKMAALAWDTMGYQISKQIGEMSTVLRGKVDGILLTGGLVRYQDLVDNIRDRCGWIAPITVYPGEMEQDALALSVLRALRGEAKILTYAGKPVWDGFEE